MKKTVLCQTLIQYIVHCAILRILGRILGTKSITMINDSNYHEPKLILTFDIDFW